MGLATRALKHFQNHTTDMAPEPMQMPVEAYINQERYAAERERIFKNLPLALALSLELPEAGDYKAMTVMETPIILCRNDQGIVKCFLNACRHRGARLCEDGRSSSRIFACPYHAWTYDRDGSLVGRYAEETFGELDYSQYGLTELPCDERSGLIWVSLTPDAY